MTPIKAAADPSGDETLAQRLEADAKSGCYTLIKTEHDILIAALRRAAAPAGNAGVRASRNSQSPDPCADLTINELIEWLDAPQYTNGFLDSEAANHMSAAAELLDKAFPEDGIPQARESFADEIKRADAAPPEASFDNASDMLGYLNAPAREAEPVAWRYVWPDGAVSWYSARPWNVRAQPVYASPSPIPEAPGGGIAALTKLAAECHRAKWQFDLSEDYRPTAKVARGLIAMAFRELHRIGDIALKMRDEIRALKPQDGGNCEHGIAKVNCGICVPSKMFSGESGL
jgi:hypothetical protein